MFNITTDKSSGRLIADAVREWIITSNSCFFEVYIKLYMISKIDTGSILLENLELAINNKLNLPDGSYKVLVGEIIAHARSSNDLRMINSILEYLEGITEQGIKKENCTTLKNLIRPRMLKFKLPTCFNLIKQFDELFPNYFNYFRIVNYRSKERAESFLKANESIFNRARNQYFGSSRENIPDIECLCLCFLEKFLKFYGVFIYNCLQEKYNKVTPLEKFVSMTTIISLIHNKFSMFYLKLL